MTEGRDNLRSNLKFYAYMAVCVGIIIIAGFKAVLYYLETIEELHLYHVATHYDVFYMRSPQKIHLSPRDKLLYSDLTGNCHATRKYNPKIDRIITFNYFRDKCNNLHSRMGFSKFIQAMNQYGKLDTDNGWVDIAKACARSQAATKGWGMEPPEKKESEFSANDDVWEKTNRNREESMWSDSGTEEKIVDMDMMEMAINDIKRAIHKKHFIELNYEIHKQIYGIIDRSQGSDYAKWINKVSLTQNIRRLPLYTLNTNILKYVDLLIRDKKHQRADKCLKLWFEMNKLATQRYSYQFIHYSMNHKGLIGVQQRYEKIGRQFESDYIRKKLDPAFSDLRSQWRGGKPATLASLRSFNDLILKHAAYNSILSGRDLVLNITNEDLRPLRMMQYMIFDKIIILLLLITMFLFCIALVLSLLSGVGERGYEHLRLSFCFEIMVGCAGSVLLPFVLWYFITGTEFHSGRNFNLQYNVIGSFFQGTLLLWMALFCPHIAARIIAGHECRKINEPVPCHDLRIIIYSFIMILGWLLIGVFLPVFFPSVREWLPALIESALKRRFILAYACTGGAIIIAVVLNIFLYGLSIKDSYKRHVHYCFYLNFSLLPICAASALFYSLFYPYLLEKQNEYLAQDKVLSSDRPFLGSVPEQEDINKKGRIIMNLIDKYLQECEQTSNH